MNVAPAYAPAPTPGFPPRLDDVPVTARAVERFGWLASSATIAGFAYAIWWGGVLLTAKKVGVKDIGIEAGCIVGAILFGWYEVHRRIHRTVLVARGFEIGVYRKGALARVMRQEQMARYELHILNTIRYLILPILLGPILLLGGAASFASSGKLDSLLMMLAGAYVCSIGASLVWTRVVCKHFYIPKDNDREEILFTGDDLKKLFG